MRLEEMPYPEIEGFDEVILPMGSIEQHGLHMPLGTDAIIARAVCDELSDRKGIPVCPTLAYGFSGEHSGFPGTIDLGLTAYATAVARIVETLGRSFRTIYIINFHGGNSAALEAVVKDLSRPGVTLVHFWRAARDAMEGMTEQEAIGIEHAGEFETSLMMAIAPELVGEGDRGPKTSISLRGRRVYTKAWHSDELTADGSFGGGGLASGEKGRAFLEACLSKLSEIVDEIREEGD